MPKPIAYTETDALIQLGSAVESIDTELTRFKEANTDAADKLVDAISSLTTALEKAIKEATTAICQAIEGGS
jgi:uncharacterized protein Yka (UPF0111/DUF47 family)